MSAVTAPPAAARLPRSVVVRRALLAGLFLAGFVALGFAFGGGAQAADRTAGPDPRFGPTMEAAPTAAAKKAAAVKKASGTPVGKAVRPVAERTGTALESGAEQAEPVTRPVTDPAAGPVAEPVRDAVREVHRAGDAASLPVHLPVRLPGLLPGADGSDDHGPDHGHGDGHGRQPGQGSEPQYTPDPHRANTGNAQAAAGAKPLDCAPTSPIPHTLGDASPRTAQRATSVSDQQPGQSHSGLPGRLPQGPASAASHTAGDGHGPRGGDHFAAVPAHPAHFGLVPGGVRAAAEPPTRQRAADILEFPG
ncbi:MULTISPECIES: hypothetical protein [Streptomyces]|uniref:hypothetical protein n=1 Tax=Streptomyces TaxID=1883 RepID=UPI000AD6DBD7|nr:MULTISPECIES: hypothetical protein [Streptomyces]